MTFDVSKVHVSGMGYAYCYIFLSPTGPKNHYGGILSQVINSASEHRHDTIQVLGTLWESLVMDYKIQGIVTY